MDNQPTSTVAGQKLRPSEITWESLENRTPSAFLLAGGSLLASLVVPVGLTAVTDWAWTSGLVLVGLAVAAVAVGLLGLYPRFVDDAPGLANGGVVGATVAGVAALGMVAMGGIALLGEGALGLDLGTPMEAFGLVAMSMAGGYSLGFTSFGLAGLLTDASSRSTGALLLLGGVLLAVPLNGELLRVVFGIGPPGWIVFPVLGLVSLDTLAIGVALRSGR